jgi:hypothetical protein
MASNLLPLQCSDIRITKQLGMPALSANLFRNDEMKQPAKSPAAKTAKKVPSAAAKKKAAQAAKQQPKSHVQISSDQLPRKSLEQALRIPRALREVHGGGPVAWPELAKAAGLGLSQSNKYYLWAAQAYGLIDKEDGGMFTLSETGRKILAPTRDGEDREAIIKAVLTPIALSRFFTDYNGSPFPSDGHLGNILEVRYSIPRDRLSEAAALLKDNGIYSGVLQPSAGDTYSVRLDASVPNAATSRSASSEVSDDASIVPTVSSDDYSKMCFVITPIGEDDSEARKHADMVLKSVIEPVTAELGFAAVRADSINRAGIITQQIFEHIAKARLCIADLSFNNPNAFYELGIRHTCKLPTVQIIRKGDRIPFDVSQGRTIKIDMTDVYAVIESIESAKRELRQHLKHILSGEYKGDDNPVNVYLPTLSVQLPK